MAVRVLMTTDVLGGVFTYTAQLARRLEEAGDEVIVATLGGPLQPSQRAALGEQVRESGFALEWMPGCEGDLEDSAAWLLELESELRPDVSHLCSFAHAFAPLASAKVLVGHSCVCSWWQAVHNSDAPPEWDAYRARVRDGIGAADAVVAPTASMLAELERLYRSVIPNGLVIHNGLPLPPPGGESRREPLILAAGRLWDAAKGLATLDAAADGLAWPVVVAGDIGDGPPPRHARPAGPLPSTALAALRRRAAIFASPARYEPFGLAILEAALDGCALVLGRIPSLLEVWGEAALYVDPDQPAQLHAALAELIEDEERRRELARAAGHRARRYGIDRTACAYRRLYRRLLTARAEVAAA